MHNQKKINKFVSFMKDKIKTQAQIEKNWMTTIHHHHYIIYNIMQHEGQARSASFRIVWNVKGVFTFQHGSTQREQEGVRRSSRDHISICNLQVWGHHIFYTVKQQWSPNLIWAIKTIQWTRKHGGHAFHHFNSFRAFHFFRHIRGWVKKWHISVVSGCNRWCNWLLMMQSMMQSLMQSMMQSMNSMQSCNRCNRWCDQRYNKTDNRHMFAINMKQNTAVINASCETADQICSSIRNTVHCLYENVITS